MCRAIEAASDLSISILPIFKLLSPLLHSVTSATR